MRTPRTVQPLPRYVRRKWLKEQTWAYFFEPPTWARQDGCPVAAEARGGVITKVPATKPSRSFFLYLTLGVPADSQTSSRKGLYQAHSIGW